MQGSTEQGYAVQQVSSWLCCLPCRFELPAFYLAHSINAWSDPDGCVHLVGNCIETSMVDLDWARRDGSFPHDLRPLLHEVLLDQRSGKATRRRLSEVVGDLPSMHPGLVGRRNRCGAWAACQVLVSGDMVQQAAATCLWSRISMPAAVMLLCECAPAHSCIPRMSRDTRHGPAMSCVTQH